MKIPPVLQKPEFRFVLLKQKDKVPFEKNWQQIANYKYNDQKLIDHTNKGGNIGVIGGYGGLLVIDFDNVEFQDKIVPLLPPTFTVLTGTGKFHKYYYTDDTSSFKILDTEKNTLADIQGYCKQVVAPGSIHPNGNIYKIYDNQDIARLSHKQMRFIFAKYMPQYNVFNKPSNDKVIEDIKSKVQIKELLRKYNYDTSKNPTMCLLGHDSKAEKCFSFDESKNLWYCFHCDKGGDVFSFIMDHDNVDFVTAKTKLIDIAGIVLNNNNQTNNFINKIINNNINNNISTIEEKVIEKPLLLVTNFMKNVEEYYKIKPFFYDKNEIFWSWNKENSMWEIIDDIDIMNSIDAELRLTSETIVSHLRNGYLEAFKRVGRLHKPINAPNTWVQFKNKVFDVKTKQIFNATPEYFVCNPIPHEIGVSDDTPNIDALFESWVGKEYVQTLHEVIAYSCLNDYPIHVLFCLVGCGRNGKTSFQKLLCNYIGLHNICSTDLNILFKSRFETFKLYKKLVCTLGETNFGVFNDTALLKRLTGQDLIGYEAKNKVPFDGFNYAKIIINSNSLPPSDDTSEGFYSRWLIIDFPNQFLEYKDILSTIPNEEYNNLCNKIIKILPTLLEKSTFTNMGTIQQRKDKYIFASNPLPVFLDNFCERGLDYFVRYSELYTAYTSFLVANKRRVISKLEFSKTLSLEGIEIRKTTKLMGHMSLTDRYIEGFRLKMPHMPHMPVVQLNIYNKFSNINTQHKEQEGHLLPKEVATAPVVKQLTEKEQESFWEQNKAEHKSLYPKEVGTGLSIYHKCYFCGLPESHYWSKTGKPMCKYCANNEMLFDESPIFNAKPEEVEIK